MRTTVAQILNNNFGIYPRPDAPQDSTPATWDNKFYAQTLAGDNSTILIFPGDKNLATFSQTSEQGKQFASPYGQQAWSSACFRMSMLGVHNMNQLTECTKILPQAK